MIFVDADACPVKADVIRLAGRADVPVTLVANSGLRPSRDPLVTVQIVPQGPDVADDWIVDHCQAGDLVITADIELAKRALEKGALVLNHTGQSFTPDSIGVAMAMRDLKRDLREMGAISDHHAGFDGNTRLKFANALGNAIQKMAR